MVTRRISDAGRVDKFPTAHMQSISAVPLRISVRGLTGPAPARRWTNMPRAVTATDRCRCRKLGAALCIGMNARKTMLLLLLVMVTSSGDDAVRRHGMRLLLDCRV